jgi:putative oxidoreductase
MAGTSDTAASIGLLLLRLGAGGMLIAGHGWPKLSHWQSRAHAFSDPIGLGSVTGFWLVTFAETACAVLIMAGWFTRVACIPPLVGVAVAGLVHHAHDPFRQKELALLYLFAFACLLFAGPGRFAIDARFGPKLSFSGK